MSNRGVHRGVRRIALPWRRFCATLPTVALIGGGIALANPAPTVKALSISKNSPAIVVPGTALTIPPVPAGTGTAQAPGLVLPAGTVPGSSTLVALDTMGIPVRAMQAYRRGASLVGAADPGCHIDWALLAAIGRAESNHGSFGGNQLDSAGVARPGIIGIRLDGTSGTARVNDTDHGLLDGDTSFDRAVGPMQFIPSTWRAIGVDADGDGAKNPQDMADAVTTTAVYLCSGAGDLTRPGDLNAAILRYNPSQSYVRTVTAIADAYRRGTSALPVSDLPAANPAPTQAGSALQANHNATATTSNNTARRPAPPARPQPAATPSASATNSPTSPPPPSPALTLPALPIPAPTETGLRSAPLTHKICSIGSLVAKTCANALLR
jgi:hypothetical protein